MEKRLAGHVVYVENKVPKLKIHGAILPLPLTSSNLN
jgi:hypothetical protein